MSTRFEDGTIQLLSLDTAQESTFEDPRLHEAWNTLSGRSTEMAQSTHAGLYDFMESERCLFIAAILQKPSQSDLDEYHGARDMGFMHMFPLPQATIVGIIYAASADIEGTLNIALSVCADALGRGLGARAARLLLRWAFGELRVHRVQAHVVDFEDDTADAAQQMLTALGFVREGTARRALLCPSPDDRGGAGRLWRNLVSYAILDTDWTLQEAIRPSVKSMWDAMFVRHEQESEEHVRIEERTEQRRRMARLRATQAREDEVPVVYRPPPPQMTGARWASESESPRRTTPSPPDLAWALPPPHAPDHTFWRALGDIPVPSSSRRFTQTPWAELFDTPYGGRTPDPGTPYESADEDMPQDDSDAASTASSSSSSFSAAGHTDFSDGELVSDAESVPRSVSVLSDASVASSWFNSWEEAGGAVVDDQRTRSE
ncbi:hypothetical protein PHLGIDRAFT_359685 [Phlebiopsis gigantea 11061_1 CR5-6]|uniref:N-acetyltransferase domain-containing protein n=1 Tax=Phlebiopsis gigantea (strain 11061_1 CR5-6) TaxID=745531 RepID=A0A0C3RPH0_PHLG1|nr:hypothetical protein PHLGIDRAFT_359685 [Phlebiopsis gigantea 11061_1 CR5-6]